MKANITLQCAGFLISRFILIGGCLIVVFFPAISAALSHVPAQLPPQVAAPRVGPLPTCQSHGSRGRSWPSTLHRSDQLF